MTPKTGSPLPSAFNMPISSRHYRIFNIPLHYPASRSHKVSLYNYLALHCRQNSNYLLPLALFRQVIPTPSLDLLLATATCAHYLLLSAHPIPANGSISHTHLPRTDMAPRLWSTNFGSWISRQRTSIPTVTAHRQTLQLGNSKGSRGLDLRPKSHTPKARPLRRNHSHNSHCPSMELPRFPAWPKSPSTSRLSSKSRCTKTARRDSRAMVTLSFLHQYIHHQASRHPLWHQASLARSHRAKRRSGVFQASLAAATNQVHTWLLCKRVTQVGLSNALNPATTPKNA